MKTFSLLALIWTLYYLAKRITGNLLTTADLVAIWQNASPETC